MASSEEESPAYRIDFDSDFDPDGIRSQQAGTVGNLLPSPQRVAIFFKLCMKNKRKVVKFRMRIVSTFLLVLSGLVMTLGAPSVSANPPALTPEGEALHKRYADALEKLQQEIKQFLPTVAEGKQASLQLARDAVQKATTDAEAAQKNMADVGTAKALVDHAKGKWLGGAEKGIANAKVMMEKATTPAEREAAEKEMAKWLADKEEGLKALAQRQAVYDEAKIKEQEYRQAHEAAQATLAKAQADEMNAANALLADFASVLSADKYDATLVKATVLTSVTPHGLAAFAQTGPDKVALVNQLFSDVALMKEMLVAGGASHGHYGRAMEIYTDILKASPNAREGVLQRLALATSLEHAQPIAQSNPETQSTAPATVDPVKRYLHYEKAYLNGELDPAFANFSVWEYRLVVNCDAPDEILQWGRDMLRNYRPDHITNPDYGWRYVSSVKTEVPYGSQNVQYDIPSQHNYQNIIKNGGVCGRRAFFGRFILRSFGIPTWGVTQHKHAALSHWTPKGWVVNLGAGFHASWWDKDEVSLSGTQFLLETQARAHGEDYLKVARAQWISRILGEQAYNERKKFAGGFWSNMGLYQARILASTAVELGPLGQELAEANEREQKVESAAVAEEDQRAAVQNGIITIPAVAHSKPTGKSSAMKSFAGGMQLHCLGGFKADYVLEAPSAGKYTLSARVATVQDGQKFRLSANSAGQPIETAVPYTLGMWEQTEPVEVSLVQGENTINFELIPGSRGVTIKEFTLTPAK
jgi:hypothetical protein